MLALYAGFPVVKKQDACKRAVSLIKPYMPSRSVVYIQL